MELVILVFGARVLLYQGCLLPTLHCNKNCQLFSIIAQVQACVVHRQLLLCMLCLLPDRCVTVCKATETPYIYFVSETISEAQFLCISCLGILDNKLYQINNMNLCSSG